MAEGLVSLAMLPHIQSDQHDDDFYLNKLQQQKNYQDVNIRYYIEERLLYIYVYI
jgi:hypothetical protein